MTTVDNVCLRQLIFKKIMGSHSRINAPTRFYEPHDFRGPLAGETLREAASVYSVGLIYNARTNKTLMRPTQSCARHVSRVQDSGGRDSIGNHVRVGSMWVYEGHLHLNWGRNLHVVDMEWSINGVVQQMLDFSAQQYFLFRWPGVRHFLLSHANEMNEISWPLSCLLIS